MRQKRCDHIEEDVINRPRLHAQKRGNTCSRRAFIEDSSYHEIRTAYHVTIGKHLRIRRLKRHTTATFRSYQAVGPQADIEFRKSVRGTCAEPDRNYDGMGRQELLDA